jgi:EXS family
VFFYNPYAPLLFSFPCSSSFSLCLLFHIFFFFCNLFSTGASDSRQHAYHTCGAGSSSYYILQRALGFLPYFIRLCQSFRAYADTKQRKHLFNALKYSLSLSLTALAVAHQAARSGLPGEVESRLLSGHCLCVS